MTTTTTPARATTHSGLRNIAIVSGIMGFLLFILTPFMPVSQVQSSLHWPQNDSLNSVNAPLESYAPEKIRLSVPISAINSLREDENLLVGTLPPDSEKSTSRGLFVRSFDGAIDVLVRDTVYFQLEAEEVAALAPDSVLNITSGLKTTTVEIPGAVDAEGEPLYVTSEEEEDKRPQITGIYTELEGDAKSLIDAGLTVDVEINSRYTSSPTMWKYATMFGGAFFLLIALVALYRLDRLDGEGGYKFWPAGFFKPRLVDGVVLGVLVAWYFFGANTSDDGFIMTMARVSLESDYMANYYRWFGVPESPFGAPYYDFLALMTTVSTASTWMRLPSLISGILIWLVVSREILPRLGDGINARKAAHWTAALMFLAFWLPYNNGLRPEPIIALGTLVAWVSFERAIEQHRLFPAAVGTIVAAFTLACGPTGLMAVAALLVSLSSLIRVMHRRLRYFGITDASPRGALIAGWTALLAPFAAAGTAVFLAVFGDQTLMTVLESIHVRGDKGPSLQWYQEWVRYEVLFQQAVDGSFSRRFAVLMAFLSVIFIFSSMLKNGKVPGSNKGPALRLMMVFLGTLFFMSFTPTKWTHHFGVWAGIAAALGALGAIALSEIATRSRHARTLVLGGLLFVFAFALSGTNGFWYVSSYGIPWWDKSIQFKAIEASTVLMVVSLVVLIIGVVQSFRSGLATELVDASTAYKRKDRRPSRFANLFAAPIAFFCAIAVLFSLASFAKAFIDQYPAYSVGLGNVRSVANKACGLADYVLVETNTNESFLSPLNSSLGSSLTNDKTRGFQPNRLPQLGTNQLPNLVSSAELLNVDGGRRSEKGVNGSTWTLPFNLDPDTVPVVGSYTQGRQFYAQTTTDWYKLPEETEESPLVVVSAAGIIEGVDADGVEQEGQKLVLQYGKSNADGSVEKLGETQMLDIGPMRKWRNLRLPLSDLPDEADVIRIHAVDSSLDEEQWLAFTPPRVPKLDTLSNTVGSEAPGLLDWSVPLQFPCQRPFNHYAGVAEIPTYRIIPDYKGKRSGTSFQDYHGGGVLGTAETVNYSYEIPAYAKDDWLRDWGSIERYQIRPNSVGDIPDGAIIDHESITRSGLWNPGHQNIDTDKKEYN
ncbi:MAG: arabinosyltransferase domain-containing protein [Corynebacterium sp.]|uniref:arabinosyltransferase domain-containing protein n=1 Tax=Corynebacterium sp. TaxID=1720 RepID=UPI0026DA769E|nr:arabinosyltransferase domain-containing protein [Corynebacterium sp.]MDO5099173.1 arabinosyltransferase domain-containing protein [Corynebacterium sp.]